MIPITRFFIVFVSCLSAKTRVIPRKNTTKKAAPTGADTTKAAFLVRYGLIFRRKKPISDYTVANGCCSSTPKKTRHARQAARPEYDITGYKTDIDVSFYAKHLAGHSTAKLLPQVRQHLACSSNGPATIDHLCTNTSHHRPLRPFWKAFARKAAYKPAHSSRPSLVMPSCPGGEGSGWAA